MSKKTPQRNDIYIPQETVHFDVDAFDTFVASHGVTMEHYRHLPCPIGLSDIYDIGSHLDHDCSNGFIYEKVGTITGFFTDNATITTFEDFGIDDGSTAIYTLPRHYDDTEGDEVLVQPRDRLFIKDFQGSCLHSEKFEHHISGSDRLRFPALKVHALIDASGNRYKQNQDFVLEKGHIKWTTQRRPGFNPEKQKGDVCAVQYSYLPYYYVEKLMHDSRVTRDVNDITGEVGLVRMQQQVLLTRERVHDKEPNNDKSPSERDVRGPRKRNFGPR